MGVSSCLAGFLLGERRVAGESVDGAGEELEFLLEGEGRWTDEHYSYGDGVSGEVFEDDRGNCRG